MGKILYSEYGIPSVSEKRKKMFIALSFPFGGVLSK